MKKSILTFLSALLMLVACNFSASAAFQNETLKYLISYKWGIVHKDAAEATLNMKRDGNNYNIMLAARTQPWADKIFEVRDTLKAIVKINGLKPVSYTKITHEKGKYKRDEIRYSISGNVTTGTTKRYRYEKGKQNVTSYTFSASGPVYDMLSIFYYIRQLDFNKMAPNKTYTATVFSGKQKETIKIRNMGREKIKMKNNTYRDSYHIRLNFTRDGGKKTSDDIDTWISTSDSHVPLYLTAKLPIGEVRAYLVGS